MVKIKEYKVGMRGKRGIVLTLPKVWCDDLGLNSGDAIEVYRDLDNQLILRAKEPAAPKEDQASGLREMMEAQ